MEQYDLVIKGGTIVDGTRFPRYTSNIAIKDGRIAKIGGLGAFRANRVIDAAGLIVAPGFVDLHTHYDAQIQWDPWCTVSGWHGVTSVVLGNCGFGFAPVRPESRERAMLMMSRTEAIPMASMQAGMLWDWVTFPEWLDTLDRIPKGVNCLSYVPLSPVMVWVMGMEAAKSRGATDGERRAMQDVLDEAMDAGACGWSVQRLGEHSAQADYDGTPMPTDTMTDEDVLAFAEVLGRRDEGFIQITQVTDGLDPVKGEGTSRDLKFQEQLAEVSGRPVIHNLVTALDSAPEHGRERLRWIEECNARGLRILGQGASIRNWFIFKLDEWNLYDRSPAWNKATTGTFDEKLAKLADPEVRDEIKGDDAQLLGGKVENLRINSSGSSAEFEQYLGKTIGEVAAEMSIHPVDAMLNMAVATKLQMEFRTEAPTSTDAALVAELMNSPYVMPGVSDGGAHTKFFVGGSYTTDLLTWLVRDTAQMTLEEAHWHLSFLPAQAAGFKDRGFLREGAPADVVVYDLAKLKRIPENDYEVAHDFPAGEWRRVERAEGYRWILVNGEVTFEDGNCTGATPGKLLRHGRG